MHCDNSPTSGSTNDADVVLEEAPASSSSFLNAFAAVAVGIVGQQDETCNNIPQQSIANMAANTSSSSKTKSN
jgi:hypothetical protein